jgi:hypothetical protein
MTNDAEEACVGDNKKEKGQRRRIISWYLAIPLYVLLETPSSRGVGSRDGDAPLQARQRHADVLDHLDDIIIEPNFGCLTFPKLLSRQI